MASDGLEELSHGQLVDRVRELGGQLALTRSQNQQLGQSLLRAEQDRETALEQARQDHTSFEREVGKAQALFDEREALRRDRDQALTQARTSLQAAADDRAAAAAHRSAMTRLEAEVRGLRSTLQEARGRLVDTLRQLGE